MAKKAKLTKEEENAMRIQAMLQGVSFEELAKAAMQDAGADDDIEIEIEDEDKPKKRGGSKRAKSNSGPILTQRFVPELEQFKGLNRGMVMDVNYSQHDIHYKEQLWAIPSRTITYMVEIVRDPKIAKDVADIFSKGAAEERQKAEDGTVRYFRVINHEENVSHKVREIAYVKVEDANGKIKTQVHVNSRVLKENNANPEKVKSNLVKLLKDIA